MNSNFKYFLITIFCFSASFAWAQNSYQWGLLPSLNLNKKISDDWSLNTKLEGRYLFESGDVNGEVDEKGKYLQTDISMVAAKKVGLNSKIGGGYLIRIKGDEIFHRTTQQYNIVQKLTSLRLAHRFVTDQTFSEHEKPEFRLRYRISTELPLDGKTVDHGEWYLKISNEYLYKIQGSDSEMEIRLVPLLGYDISENLKWETGLDYRLSPAFSHPKRDSFWVSMNFYIDL